MKKLLIFALTVFGLNTIVSQTNNDVQKNYLISDTSQVLSSAEKNQTSNFNSISNVNTNSVIQVNTNENFESTDSRNNSAVIASQAKQKKRPFLKKLKNHSFFSEQFTLKMPHM